MTRMVLDPDQAHVLTTALKEADRLQASPRERKALVEALSVESNIRNLPGGDRDSRGPLQQRSSQGWMHPTNVKLAVRDFLTHARANSSMHGSAGQLAQSVQRSAFPARYDQKAGLASQLLQHYGGGSGADAAQSSSGHLSLTYPGSISTQNKTVNDPEAEKRVLLAQHLLRVNPHSMLLRLGVVSPDEPTTKTVSNSVSSPGHTVSIRTSNPGTTGKLSNPGAHLSGVAHFEGKAVAAWIAPALEYARHHGWKGTVQSGFRTLADQTRIYNSGVRPAAKPGTSNHEFTAFPGGAIDASDAEHLSAILQKSPYAKQLVWAGSKDPVHFSHPHNGSY